MNIKRTRPRGFAPWSPRLDTVALLARIDAVLSEYAEHLPLTNRQIFYRLVGTQGYDKTEQAYSRLCEVIGRARRAGIIAFWKIRDDGGASYDNAGWSGVEGFLRTYVTAARSFTLDRQEGQPVRLWLLCEAGGMAPMLAGITKPFGVPVQSSGGFDSLTAKHALASELAEVEQAEVLHVGDHDPSGVHLFTALAEDVGAMVEALGGNPPRFTRLAVTPAQAEALRLPTAPPKTTDRRAFAGETVQAEAIPPDVLARMVLDAIEARQDEAVRQDVLDREADMRAELLTRLGVEA